MSERDYPYKVSVCIITYNQVNYIRKAVDGAIAQEVDFPYEIIIGDDCSTDGTREILLDYKQKHPDLIKLNLQEEHDEVGIAGRKNNITNIRSAQGQYIAFCDGDDYWISKDKLQKQADFMDTHPEYAFCFHDTLRINVQKGEQYYISDKYLALRKSATFNFNDLISRKMTLTSSSVFFRTKYFQPLPDWFWNVYTADRFLQLIAAQNGLIQYIRELKSARLLNSGSVSHNYFRSEFTKKIKENDANILLENFDIKNKQPFNFKAQYYLNAAAHAYSKKEYISMLKAIFNAISNDWRISGHVAKLGIGRLHLKFIEKFNSRDIIEKKG